MRVVRHRVEPARFPRHATQYALCSEKYSPHYAELTDGFDHICRTARRIYTNVGRKRRNALFVKVHKPQKQPPKRYNAFYDALDFTSHTVSPARSNSLDNCPSSSA